MRIKNVAIYLSAILLLIFGLIKCRQEFPSEDIVTRIKKNEKVSRVVILDRKRVVFRDIYELEIQLKNDYRIILDNVNWSLKNKGIEIPVIYDITYHGGKVYEIEGNMRTFYKPNDVSLLGKIINRKIHTVDEIINNIEELYKLYELFETKSRTEFFYKDRFLILADFSRD